MRFKMNPLLLALAICTLNAVAAETSSPVETVSRFYAEYFAYDYRRTPTLPRPKIGMSTEFSAIVENTDRACKQFADYPCGWGGDGDQYLDAQEYDTDLTFENTGMVVEEIESGVVRVEMNVYPSIKDAGDYYHKSIVYRMRMEAGKWVVDDVIYSDGKSTKQNLIEQAEEAREYRK